MTKTAGLIAAVMGATGVMIGAFGAHGLPEYLQQQGIDSAELLSKRLDQFEVGVRYQLIHALALLCVWSGASQLTPKLRMLTVWSWTLGVLVFSGLLYLLVALNQPKLGMIVPIGGVLMIVGWITLGLSIWMKKSEQS